MFFRKSRVEPLPVTMSAVRMGERLLQVGVDEPSVVSTLAAKVGLSGSSVCAVPDQTDATRIQSEAARAGVLMDLRVAPLEALPVEDNAFDLVVVHSAEHLPGKLGETGLLAAAREWHRSLRIGGRVVTIEHYRSTGFRALLPGTSEPGPSGSSRMVGLLEQAGFRPVRQLAEREGYVFCEGLKTG